MPLKGIPASITPELLYTLARMGHGDFLVIADANFPSDSIATSTKVSHPIRVHGLTSEILSDILKLIPLDSYCADSLQVMDRVTSDKESGLEVPAYAKLAAAGNMTVSSLCYVERFQFYELARKAFAIIQTDDRSLYANVIVYKGVL